MGSLSNRLKAFPFSRYRQVVILGNQMNNIRKKALPETTLITSHHYWLPVCQCGQIAGIVIGREIDINSLPGSLGQLNGRNHITVCRNNNSHITVLLIGVCHNLRHNASICLFLFMRMDDIAAAETGNVLAQILAKNQLELWILLVCLKERILASVFLESFVGRAEEYLTAISSWSGRINRSNSLTTSNQ